MKPSLISLTLGILALHATGCSSPETVNPIETGTDTGTGAGGQGGSTCSGACGEPACLGVLGFQTSPPVLTMGGATSFVTADLNGDGEPDLLGVGESGLDVMLNEGAGAFAAPVFVPVGLRMATPGDVNGDGKPDVVGVYWAAGDDWGSVRVLLNQGDGTFGPPAVFPAEDIPGDVEIADLDGDGDNDLALAHQTGTASVMFNQGDGTFGPPITYAVGLTGGLSVADLDGDGDTDLVLGQDVPPVNPMDLKAQVMVLFNQGDGTFELPVLHPVDGGIRTIVVADLDGDGAPDIAAGNSEEPGGIRLLLNQGNGTFAAPALLAAGTSAESLRVADMNGDGAPDLVARGWDTLTVLVQQGGGAFSEPKSLWQDASSVPALADFDGDGKTDVAQPNGHDGNVTLLFGLGDGTFPGARAYAAPGFQEGLVMGDLDGDGRLDLAALASAPDIASGQEGFVHVLLGNQDGTFTIGPDYPAGADPRIPVASDIDGDADLDLMITSHWGVSALENLGGGVFSAPVQVSASASSRIVMSDLDGDGAQDLVVGAEAMPSVDVLVNAGDGTFLAPVTYVTATPPTALVVMDLNGDDKPDLAIGDGGVTVRINNGDGTLSEPKEVAPGYEILSLAAADLNGDGQTDLAAAGRLPNEAYGTLLVMLNQGGGQLAAPVSGPEADFSIAPADLDGDGEMDLAVSDYFVSALLGDGAGQLSVGLQTNIFATPILAGDLDGDGRTDLATGSALGHRLVVLLSGCAEPIERRARPLED